MCPPRKADRRLAGPGVFSLLIKYDSKVIEMSEVWEPENRMQKDCLPQDPNSDEDLTDDQITKGMMKLTAKSLAEEPDY
jgi:hypothetical protein